METNEPTKSEIKNIHLLSSLDEATLKKLDTSALMHRKYAYIFFKILKFDGRECIIQVKQEKSFYKKYADTKRLVEIVHETFDSLLPNIKVIAHPVPYVEPVTDVVTPEWIRHNMTEKHIRLKDIVNETGIDKTQLSANISGDRELSQPVKAMFYYYFLAKAKPEVDYFIHTIADKIVDRVVDDFVLLEKFKLDNNDIGSFPNVNVTHNFSQYTDIPETDDLANIKGKLMKILTDINLGSKNSAELVDFNLKLIANRIKQTT